jgi:hypothetical protein
VVCSDAVGAGDALALSCSAKHVMCCECSAVYADSVLSGGAEVERNQMVQEGGREVCKRAPR